MSEDAIAVIIYGVVLAILLAGYGFWCGIKRAQSEPVVVCGLLAWPVAGPVLIIGAAFISIFCFFAGLGESFRK